MAASGANKKIVIDWEEFKRIVAPLNEPRTPQQRMEIFERSAQTAWHHQMATIPVAYLVPTEDENLKLKSPTSLSTITCSKIKEQLFKKAYIDLINHITDQDGVYPRKWDGKADELKSKLNRIKIWEEEEVQQWARQHYHEN